ncbi:MAG: molybdenum cofactor biosynthesis protein MoaE [Gemmatimonadales bacterium]
MGYLTREPLDLSELLGTVQSPGRGGLACFLGTVRDQHQGCRVVRLDYHAYEPMVEAECARIVAEAESRWDVAVALRHRLGRLEIGDAAVAVVAASPHREEAFVACRHVIEELKRRVPIWKRETFTDGTVEWVGSGEAGRRVSRDAEAPNAELVGKAGRENR